MQLNGLELKNDLIEIRNLLSYTDVLKLSIFPIILVLLYVLLYPNIGQYQLSYSSPQTIQFVTAELVHNNLIHLISNLAAYIVFATLGIILVSYISEKKAFYRALAFSIVFLALITPIIDIAIYPYSFMHNTNVKTTCGASGIISAIAGFIPAILMLYIFKKDNQYKNYRLINGSFAYLLLSYMAAMLSFFILLIGIAIGVQNIWIISYIIIAILLISLFMWYSRKDIKKLYKVAKKSDNRIVGRLLLCSLIIFLVVPVILFPTDFLLQGIDITGHFVGIWFGAIIGATAFKINLL